MRAGMFYTAHDAALFIHKHNTYDDLLDVAIQLQNLVGTLLDESGVTNAWENPLLFLASRIIGEAKEVEGI